LETGIYHEDLSAKESQVLSILTPSHSLFVIMPGNKLPATYFYRQITGLHTWYFNRMLKWPFTPNGFTIKQTINEINILIAASIVLIILVLKRYGVKGSRNKLSTIINTENKTAFPLLQEEAQLWAGYNY
jgi:hypothetical protein